jgi:hypothetical protein
MHVRIASYLLSLLFFLGISIDSIARGSDKVQGQIIGFIDNREVTASELKSAMRSIEDIIALDKGKETNSPSSSDIEKEAWTQLALLHEARQRNLRVSDQEIDEFIRNNQRFQVDYRFDPGRYRRVLSQLQIDPHRFHQTAENWLLVGKLYDQIRSKVTVNDEEVREAFWEAYELRRVSYVIFPLSNYMKKGKPVGPNTGELSQEFQEGSNAAEQQSLADAEKCHQLVQDLMEKRKLSFEAAVKTLELTAAESGYFSRNVPPPNIHQPDWLWSEAFLISRGQLSRVVPVRSGYLFFTVSEIFPPTEKQYARAHDNFLSTYRRHKENESIEEYRKKLLNKIRVFE